jgi:hypothetical protein
VNPLRWLVRPLARWWNAPERRKRREAGRALDVLFARPDLLAGSSLRPDHRARVQLLDLSRAPARIGFGIVRHPRPYAFSRQFHEVLELYVWHADEQRLERAKGVNLTRARGSDGDPPAFGTGA